MNGMVLTQPRRIVKLRLAPWQALERPGAEF